MGDAVLFDLDGVLIDSKEFHYKAWKKFWDRRGIKHTKKDFMKSFGMPNTEIFKEYFGKINEEAIHKMSEEKEESYRQAAKGKLKVYPGSRKLLISLRKSHFKVALATSSPKSNIPFIMKETKFKGLFHAIINGSDIKKGKPNPEIFLKAAKKLKVMPKHCLVVEDSNHGLLAAKQARMRSIGVATSMKKSKIKYANLVIKDVSKISVSVIRGVLNG